MDLLRIVDEGWRTAPGDSVRAKMDRQGGGQRPLPQQQIDQGTSSANQGSTFELRMHCRRDDYAFLPADAQGGLPCLSLQVDVNQTIDPVAVADRMVQEVRLPAITLGMNPRKGLVAVPTWFWVEGYDGRPLGDTQSLALTKRSCQLVVARDERGDPRLDEDGRPQVDERCTTSSQTLTVEVRLRPRTYTWDFGDQQHRAFGCQGLAPCSEALGQPYRDNDHPSSVRHAYVWTSLNQGEDDAYTIGLRIEFQAEFRVSVDGQLVADWQEVPGEAGSRSGIWSAKHQVQEVQAVLGVPCPWRTEGCDDAP